MQLNTAMFMVNGRCGYILKPEYMRKNELQKRKEITLGITVISGQQFPKPKGDQSSDVINPFVEIEIVGNEGNQEKQRTKKVQNNGNIYIFT